MGSEMCIRDSDPPVNEEWNCDKGRWAFTYPNQGDRIATPLIREADGGLRPASWSEAVTVAVAGLTAAAGRAGVLVGGRLTYEDATAYSKFARMVLGTNDIDFRARAHSVEEAQFLAARVAGRPMAVSYADLEAAPLVVLAGLDPEEESPIVFLRLRKAARKHGLKVVSIAPFATRGLAKMNGTLLMTPPGGEAAALAGLQLPQGAIIVVGERLATSPGAYSAAARLADTTGARLAWIPRRAGDRGALEAGCLPGLLPGGRPVDDDDARREAARLWHVGELPSAPGRDTTGILAAAAAGDIDALLIGGVEINDLPDPVAALTAIDATPFVVSLELRHSAVTARADVVFPVAPVAEKAGSFLNWEGRVRHFARALPHKADPDARILAVLARAAGQPLPGGNPLGSWRSAPDVVAAPVTSGSVMPGLGQALLASWRMLLDAGRLQDGEPHLAGTARAVVGRLSARTAAEIGVSAGEDITVRTERGGITVPLVITEMPDRVVWLPMNSAGSAIHRQLGVTAGAVVSIGPVNA